VFIHPKLAGSVGYQSSIEGEMTPLAGDIIPSRKSNSAAAAAPKPVAAAQPPSNGHASAGGMDADALVRAITDQVMHALNGAAK
jgi:L-fuculose-phosphate aldolase